MKGYFQRLAKQSGVSIAPGKPKLRPSAAETAPPGRTAPLEPLHAETVVLVSPETTKQTGIRNTQSVAERRHSPSVEKPAPNPNANVTGDARDVVSTSQASSTLREIRYTEHSDSSRQDHRENAITHLAQPAETTFAKDDAATVLEGSRDDASRVVNQTNLSPAEPSPRQPGVIRVGESRDQIDVNMTRETDLLSEVLPGMAPIVSSIPRDYLEGIRDWLNSPPVVTKSEGLQASKADPPAIVATVKEAEHRASVKAAEPAMPAQNEIQEFSLSIGKISIVVEEPPAAKQPVTVASPPASAPVNSAPPKHDAFALTRSYFRGF